MKQFQFIKVLWTTCPFNLVSQLLPMKKYFFLQVLEGELQNKWISQSFINNQTREAQEAAGGLFPHSTLSGPCFSLLLKELKLSSPPTPICSDYGTEATWGLLLGAVTDRLMHWKVTKRFDLCINNSSARRIKRMRGVCRENRRRRRVKKE